ncbi:hypothetical protein XELAEV_18033807mg [Xenopus laevis]|uniref:GST N-terminal domain-containing protein n=1 Tax=Xenopus laevis TaxID=8355 RepID=A0A974CLB3_XENLA|nr:hypothetical protein XELAEV_18033807mg [Xenopus laevis]
MSDQADPVPAAPAGTEGKLILYHWTHSFSSQKVRLVIAEKSLKCEEHAVSLPLSENNEPWFMRLNPSGEVPVLVHGENIICEATQIIDYLEQTFLDAQIGSTESELKKLAQENPDLEDAYSNISDNVYFNLQTKLQDHDNIKFLKKILEELEKVLDQVETELQRRNEETPDVSLAVTLNRLRYLGFARRNWGNGKRPSLEAYYEPVLPTAFRVAKKRAPTILGSTVMVGLLAGAGYFFFLCARKRLFSVFLSIKAKYFF